ncbi:MAG TPA: membrane protein insertion efficiency factor YidD [Rhizomicrobium sp.]|nr:membrane protein insertion efficiency factor YidD [Rhizomicrobium sp.]
MRYALVQPVRAAALAVLLAPIYFYRWFLGPLLPRVCRFEPSCSTYAVEALKTHGPLKGAALAARRLLRCHPFTWLGGSSGFDPVPPPR